MDYRRRIFQGAVIVFTMSILAAILGFSFRMVLARNLTPAEYGTFYAVLSFVGFLILFKDLGMGSALAKFIPHNIVTKNLERVKSAIITVFTIQFLAAGIIAVLLIVFSRSLALNYFKTPSATIVIIFIALSYFLSSFFDIFLQSAQGFQNMFFASLTETLRSFAVLCIIFVLFHFTTGVFVPAFAFFFAMLFLPFIYGFLFLKMFPTFLKLKFHFSKEIFQELLTFGFPMLLSSAGLMIITYTDTLALTFYKSVEDVGLYNAALPTAQLLYSISQTLSFVLLPLTSELYARGHRTELKEGIDAVHRYALLIIVPAAITLFFFSKTIITLLFSAVYIKAALPLEILAIGGIFYTLSQINTTVLVGIGKPGINVRIVLFSAVLNLIGNILLIPHFGMVGAAGATAASYVCMMFLSSYEVKKQVGSFVNKEHFIKLFFLAVIFLFTLIAFEKIISFPLYTSAILSIFFAGCIYVLAAYSFGLFTVQEVKSLILRK